MNPETSPRLVLVTGMSGAGRTAVLKILEDFNYEAVDNLPLSLLPSLVSLSQTTPKNLAVCEDARTREFSPQALSQNLKDIALKSDRDVRVLFLDCDDEELARRYAETRHRHPLAGELPVIDGIRIEREIIQPVRDTADIVLDTTGLTLGDLKHAVAGHFAENARAHLSIFVTSFSFKKGLPRNADMSFDVRFLKNPHYDEALRAKTGRDTEVQAFIEKDDGFGMFFNTLTGLLAELLPRYALEGKSYLTIALGCTGGRHRSVFVAERLAQWLNDEWADKTGADIRLTHRDMDSA